MSRISDVRTHFFSRVWRTSNCWIWTGSRSSKGYGMIQINKKLQQAHRVSWEFANGEIPEGMWVLHKCDNPCCVNPEHLFLGTQLDNARDCASKKRAGSKPKIKKAKPCPTEVLDSFRKRHNIPHDNRVDK